jgi:hypothetical protein
MLTKVAGRISLASRRKKFRLFIDAFHPDAETTIVDVGVVDSGFGEGGGASATHNFLEAMYPWPGHITAFSNAVVEHVGGEEAQRTFVGELCRVARRVYVTTPNRWFPIDVHTLLPGVHWLPENPRNSILRRLGKEGINPLGARQFRALFPRPVRIVNTGIALIAIG